MLSLMGQITPPSITAADAEALADVLDLTVDTGASDEAALIRLYRRALDAVERHTGRIMRSSGWRLCFALNRERLVPLPVFPVTGLTAARLNGSALTGAELVCSGGGYLVKLPEAVSGDLELDVTAGYADPVRVPPSFEAAVLAVAADMYEHRESQVETNLSENRTIRFVLNDLKFFNCG